MIRRNLLFMCSFVLYAMFALDCQAFSHYPEFKTDKSFENLCVKNRTVQYRDSNRNPGTQIYARCVRDDLNVSILDMHKRSNYSIKYCVNGGNKRLEYSEIGATCAHK